MKKYGRNRWVLPAIPLALGVAILLGVALRGRGGRVVERPDVRPTVPLPTGATDLPLPAPPAAGSKLVYSLKADIAIRSTFGLAGQKVPFEVAFENVRATFDLLVRLTPGNGRQICPRVRKFEGDVRVGGGAGTAGSQHVSLEEPEGATGEYSFLVSPRWTLEEILVDERARSDRWIRGGIADRLETALSFLELLPPLPAPDSGEREYRADLGLFNLIGFEYALRVVRDSGSSRIEGHPRRLTMFLGSPAGARSDLEASTAEAILATALLSAGSDHPQKVSHRVDSRKGDGFIKISIDLECIASASRDAVPEPDLQSPLRFGSGGTLRKFIADLKGRQSTLKEEIHADPSELGSLLHLLDRQPSEDPLREEARAKLAWLLATHPELFKDLTALLENLKTSESGRLDVVRILSSTELRGSEPASEAAVVITRSIRDDNVALGCLVQLGNFRTQAALDFLVQAGPESRLRRDARNSALRTVMEAALQSKDEIRASRALDYFASMVREGKDFDPVVLNPFTVADPYIDRYVAQQWESGSDKTAALKLMLARSASGSGQAAEFRDRLKSNLSTYASEDQVLREFIPMAAGMGNAEVLKFLAELGSTPNVRAAAATRLALLQGQGEGRRK